MFSTAPSCADSLKSHNETRVKEPALRAKQIGSVRDAAGVEEWTKLHSEETIAVNVLVHAEVRQKIAAAKRRGALAAVGSASVAAQPQIVVALDAELEELIERHAAQRGACANAGAQFVVVAGGARQPVRV